MNYRERQLRQIIKNDYVPKIQHEQLAQEKQALEFKHGQILLDVDYQLQTHTKQENETLKENLVEWESRYAELETNLNEQATQAKHNLKKSKEQSHQTQQLYLQKINDLEQALFSLAKQKLKGKKEATELLTQLEANWKQDQETWTSEKQTLIEELTNQKQAYGDLILEHKKQIQEKETKISELENWSTGQHNRILELEKQIQAAEQAQEQSQQEYKLAQEEIKNLNQQIHQTNLKLTNTEQKLQQTQTKLTQAQEKAQQDNQAKQTLINQLQQDKLNQQTQITQLSQEITTKTQTISQQLSQINQKDTKLTKQKNALEQLLANHEQRLNELGGNDE